MRTHASAIRGTTGTPFDRTPYRVTRKGRALYLFFQQWPSDAICSVVALEG